jgi:hypothetical protein
MPSSSRITDQWIGQCCCHSSPTCIPMGGIIISGSHNAGSGILKQARMLDITIGWCGDPGMIVSSSATSKTNTLGKARIGSQVIGCNIGIVISGMPTHEVGG